MKFDTKKKRAPGGKGAPNSTNIFDSNYNKKLELGSQKQKLLSWLKIHGSIDTLTARTELYIMSPASRIGELKAAGHKIINRGKFIGKVKIADYVLVAEKGAYNGR